MATAGIVFSISQVKARFFNRLNRQRLGSFCFRITLGCLHTKLLIFGSSSGEVFNIDRVWLCECLLFKSVTGCSSGKILPPTLGGPAARLEADLPSMKFTGYSNTQLLIAVMT